MSPKKALRRFLMALGSAAAGTRFEVGMGWCQRHGWRVYQRVGDQALFMGSKEARALHQTYRKLAARPEWQSVEGGLRDTLDSLIELADEVDRKNRDRVIPEGAAEFMPAEGHA